MRACFFRRVRWLRFNPSVWLLIVLAEFCAAGNGDWIPEAGSSDAWVRETAPLREVLDSMEEADVAVGKWLPRLRRRCEVLGKLRDFEDSRNKLYLEQTIMMARDLAAGRAPFRKLAGQNVPYVYWSETLQALQGTRFVVPGNYDPQKEYQVFLYYKLGGGLVFKKDNKWVEYGTPGAKFADPQQPSLEQCLRSEDTFHTWSALSPQVKGRMGQASELVEMPAAFCGDFSISPDRVFLSGFSDGGFDSLFMGFYYPDLIAGIAPGVANWQYTNIGQVGLFNTPTLVLDGWGDAGYVRENFTRLQALSGMGYPIEGRFGHFGHSDKIWSMDEMFFPMLEWARQHRRDLWPRRVRYATWNLHWDGAYWVSISRMENPALAAMIDAQVERNLITLTTRNVAACRLRLSDQLVDRGKKLRVVANGVTRYDGDYRDELQIELAPPPAGAKWLKSPGLPGGITVAVDRSTYIGNVHGTRSLSLPGREWLTVMPGDPHEAYHGVAPKVVTHGRDALRQHNLILIGRPAENPVLAEWADQLPVKFGAGGFSIGTRVYDQPGHAVRFVHPHPLNPAKHIIVVACNDVAVARAQNFYGLKAQFFTPSPFKIREGDCVVYGVDAPADLRLATALSDSRRHHYTFTADWQVPDETPIGEATACFDFESVQVLTADALQEACGVDVGVVSGFPPGFNQWRGWLEKGPITFNEVATLRMLPEFISTAEVTGKQLRSIMDRAVAVSRVESIDDDMIYTIATDYSALNGGVLSHRHASQGWRHIPDPIHFKDTEDLRCQTEEVLPGCAKLRQTDMQVTEALVKFIRNHKRIAPRRFTGDLGKFITNPRAHAFPENDWLHVAVPFGRRSDTIHVGLRSKKDPPSNAVPRDPSQQFMDEGPAGETFDFGELDAELPVMIRFESGTNEKHGNVVQIHLENKGEKDVVGQLVLAAGDPQPKSAAWPPKAAGKEEPSGVFGLAKTLRKQGKVISTEGAVLLHETAPARYGRIARDVSYAFGLLGVHRELELPAKSRRTITLLQFEKDGTEAADVVNAFIQEWVSFVRTGSRRGI